MLKSEKAGQKFATESRLTRVQELKQARAQQNNNAINHFTFFIHWLKKRLFEFVQGVFRSRDC